MRKFLAILCVLAALGIYFSDGGLPDLIPDLINPKPDAGGRLHVLVVEETGESNLTRQQSLIQSSVEWAEFIEKNGIEYRWLDQDADLVAGEQKWAEGIKRAKEFGKFPCMVIGKTHSVVFELPANVAESRELVEEYL